MMSTFPHTTPKRRSILKTFLLWAALMVPASALLYGTSSHVRELQKDLSGLKQDIAAEKEALRVLKAEWAYLNNPQRLGTRARSLLGFKNAMSAKQVAKLEDVSYKVALRETPAIIDQFAAAPDVGESVQIAKDTGNAPSSKLLASPISYSAQLVDALQPMPQNFQPPLAGKKKSPVC